MDNNQIIHKYVDIFDSFVIENFNRENDYFIYNAEVFKKLLEINSNFGLGESVVSGLVLPDEYIVDKRSLNEGFEDPILKIKLGLINI